MSDAEIERELGAMEEAIDTLKFEVTALRVDIVGLKHMLDQAQGGIKTLIAVGTLAGAVGAAFMSMILKIKGGG